MRRWPRWLFGTAGIYGLGAVLPLYLAPLSPETAMRWAFAGAAGATQLLYLLIATDPVRYRPTIPVGIVSKLSFAAPMLWLCATGKAGIPSLLFATIDLALAAAFAAAFAALRRSRV